ncbi:MAG: hypothetical protein NC084_00295 [Bacteroides sp.]|nr:sporulation protein YabP [Eubacterium sp.]MCM1417253.1 sporulation protein YabP [Roseburia sp.]MCM1461127.1 hypothetical protein [Bacteroides sp.]
MNNHRIILENRSLLHATGVKSTESFRDERIVLHTECGDLAIYGSALSVHELDMGSGDFEVSGRIDALKYLSDDRHIPDNFISKLFR